MTEQGSERERYSPLAGNPYEGWVPQEECAAAQDRIAELEGRLHAAESRERQLEETVQALRNQIFTEHDSTEDA